MHVDAVEVTAKISTYQKNALKAKAAASATADKIRSLAATDPSCQSSLVGSLVVSCPDRTLDKLDLMIKEIDTGYHALADLQAESSVGADMSKRSGSKHKLSITTLIDLLPFRGFDPRLASQVKEQFDYLTKAKLV